MSARTRGVVLWSALAAGALALTGCAGPVEIDGDQRPADAEACAPLLDAVPARLADEEPREVEPAGAGLAFGDPAIVVTCGVGEAAGFGETSLCEEVDGVGWYAPEDQYADQDADVTLYAVSYEPLVAVTVPADYRPDGVAAALADLSGPVAAHLTEVRDCL